MLLSIVIVGYISFIEAEKLGKNFFLYSDRVLLFRLQVSLFYPVQGVLSSL